MTGTVVVTYTVNSGGIHADAVPTGLMVNGATMNLNSHADYTVTGSAKKLVVATRAAAPARSATRSRAPAATRSTWDDASQCGALDGAWSTGIGNDTWSTSITNYAQCKAHCPSSGTLAHTGGLSKRDGDGDVRRIGRGQVVHVARPLGHDRASSAARNPLQ